MRLWRQNSYTTIHGAPQWFLDHLEKILSIPVQAGTQPGHRFGSIYEHEGTFWASLLVGNRVPAGLTERVMSVADWYTQQGWPIEREIVDNREMPDECYPWQSVQMPWRPYQDDVHQQILRHGVGIVDAPPRSGKTAMAARAIDAIAQPMIYLAPGVAIVRQTYHTLVSHFGEGLVECVDGGSPKAKRDLTKPIIVSTVASALRLPKDFWRSRRMLVIDEFHHAAAESYHALNALSEHIYYRLAFTGTHWRTGDDSLAMEGICSNVLYRIPIDYLVQNAYLTTPFVSFVPIRYSGGSGYGADWRQVYDAGIVNNEGRNQTVAQYATYLAEHGHRVIVLVNRRPHADLLGELIPDSEVVKGGAAALTSKTLLRFKRAEFPILIGTSVIGEGVDVPNASALIYAGGLGASVQMMQSYFRPLTAFEGKPYGAIYDFYDLHHPTLQRQSEARHQLASVWLGKWLQPITL